MDVILNFIHSHLRIHSAITKCPRMIDAFFDRPLALALCLVCRMSVFFFRLQNLRREDENKKRNKPSGGNVNRRGARDAMFNRRSLTVGRRGYQRRLNKTPSHLFEKTPLTPSDSLDEIALQIPRCLPYRPLACLFLIYC